MAITAISAISTQYITSEVISATTDPTGASVGFAFVGPYASTQQAVEQGVNSGTTFYTGSWQADVGSPYTAQVLVGPVGGVVALSDGAYAVWVSIGGTPERPVLLSGPLIVW